MSFVQSHASSCVDTLFVQHHSRIPDQDPTGQMLNFTVSSESALQILG